jgi:hypothetical protein
MGEKHLQMRPFRDVRRRASSCPTRPVTPEVAGSSPVAPAEAPWGDRLAWPVTHVFLVARRPRNI